MQEIDKGRFGAFLAALRREKGLTQKQLAQRIFVSDKAVSKWERGAGLPDISLLIPLAEALGVSVTELLEGRRLEPGQPVGSDETEQIVRRALALSGEKTARGGPDRKKWGARYGLCLALALAEGVLLARGMIEDSEHWAIYYPAALLTALSAGFGLYFCLFAKTRLPWYHDVEHIGMYYDGPMRMNVPGVQFNNRNWPHILRAVRVWCLLSMTLSGAVCMLAKALLGPGPAAQWLPMTSLAGCWRRCTCRGESTNSTHRGAPGGITVRTDELHPSQCGQRHRPARPKRISPRRTMTGDGVYLSPSQRHKALTAPSSEGA